MDRNTKKAISKNRVRILGLDYFDLTGPLLASELLTTKKHKEIKTEASTNKARVDLLLEWLDESAPGNAFPAFLQGVRNCEEGLLAKKIKKEAANGGIDIKRIKAIKPAVTLPIVGVAKASPFILTNVTSSPDKQKLSKSKPKQKVKKEINPLGLGSLTTVPFNGLPLLSTPLPPTPASRKRKSGADKPKTPGNLNGTPKSGDIADVKVVGRVKTEATLPIGGTTQPPPRKHTPGKAARKSFPIASNSPSTSKNAIATPRTTRKSSNSDKDKGEDAAGKVKIKLPKVLKKKSVGTAAGTLDSAKPKSPSSKPVGKAKAMTFKEVEIKQLDCRQKFKFKNTEAVSKVVHFKDKTDISYLGCPFEENNKICEKKVELKSKEFVCESRHRSPNCKHIPRLTVTCNDGTADLQLILLKSNVEVFIGKTSADFGNLSVNEIKDALDKTIGKKYTVEVNCEKMKKAAKKAGIPKWNNVATIWEEGPAKKKQRKN